MEPRSTTAGRPVKIGAATVEQPCANCGDTFAITEDDRAFLDFIAPTVGGKRFPMPLPTHCPECRQLRRLGCRNDRNYYSNTCQVCKKSLVSSYSPDKPFGVLCDTCFWGDRWDPLEYGLEYDFSKPFFGQFATLRASVPRIAIYHTQCENSEYIVHSSRSRNCYMSSSLVDDEEVHYSDLTFESKNCLDLFSSIKMELCYECTFCESCFQCEYCDSCNNLSDSYLCYDCKGSDFLVGCIGKRNVKDKILNEDASHNECVKTIARLKIDPAFRQSFEAQFRALKLTLPHRDAWMINTENCTGTYIWNSKNAHFAFNARNLHDVRYYYEGHTNENTCDTTRVANGEMLYECASIIDLKSSAFCNLTYQCGNLLYCDNCNGTHNCFGCVSLKKHQWCILNRQYTEEEYKALVPRIIEHMRSAREWGEFFPIKISPFGYNETKAHEWYPMDKKEVLGKGWKWSDYEPPFPNVTKTIPGKKLPPNISDVPDDILNWAIVCEVTNKPFKIIKQELQFYRQRGLPVPHRTPKQRHYDRIAPHNVRKLYSRTCGKCGAGIQTTYAPERPEIIYCERCYLEAVY